MVAEEKPNNRTGRCHSKSPPHHDQESHASISTCNSDDSPGRPPSSRSTSELSLFDLEAGQHSQSLRDQSKRLSELVKSRTELRDLDPLTPDPPKKISTDKETSGIRYWLSEAKHAKEHGGDYKTRNKAAFRAALASFITFAILVFPHQQIMGAVWIGNIFMHANIKDSFGASYTSVKGFGTSIILTTAFAWPVAYFLSMLTTTQACILLPFVIFIMTFLIMSCPQLTASNLMILVMYILVATVVRGEIEWWEPFGWCATYLIGLGVALIMNIFPMPNFALSSTHVQLERLEKDLTMLLLQCKAYADNTATVPGISRAAIASVELLHTRITKTVKTLKAKLPATKVELSWLCKEEAAKDLSEWVTQAEKLEAPLQSLRTALVQRVLGEEHHLYSPTLREAKAIIKDEIGPARDRMVDAMITSVAVCDAWADPSSHRTVLPDVQDELASALFDCRQAFQRAMKKAAEKLGSNPQTNIPIFAHLTRRMSAFSALFELGDSLLAYLEQHSWEAQEIRGTVDKSKGQCLVRCAIGGFSAFIAFTGPKWLWHSSDSFRLALKTSVGMSLASLFVSVPFLWDIAQPFGVWPGLTIASVSLANTGSSFHKAADRLFGTLLAAAFALLISDLFPGNEDYIKIPAITIYTYVVIYLRNAEHAYKYTYAATSIGSMLYGSVKNDFNIAGYIPKRIELIFVGVLIFSFVELLLFPRSSRKMVEGLSFQFFLSVRDFMKQAAICTRRMHEFTVFQNGEYSRDLLGESDVFQLEKLTECHAKLKTESAKLKKELESGLDEPHMGLSLELNPESFRGLAKEQGDCALQASLLLKALKQLFSYCQQEGHPIREMDWPRVHSRFFKEALAKAEYSCEWLKTAFPDGRLRAQCGNSVKAVTAAASFRGFEDVRLRTIAKWSDKYSQFIHQKGYESLDPIAIMTLGITTTFILELCRHMQKAGMHVEAIAHNFPPAYE